MRAIEIDKFTKIGASIDLHTKCMHHFATSSSDITLRINYISVAPFEVTVTESTYLSFSGTAKNFLEYVSN